MNVVQSTARLQLMTALLLRGTRDLKNHFFRTRLLFDQVRQQVPNTADNEFSPFLSGESGRLDRILFDRSSASQIA